MSKFNVSHAFNHVQEPRESMINEHSKSMRQVNDVIERIHNRNEEWSKKYDCSQKIDDVGKSLDELLSAL